MKQCSLTALAILALSIGPTTVLADAFFGAKADFGTGSYPCAVAIGDLNGDGKPDMATANHGANTISVLLGNGNGTFGAKSDFPAGTSPRFVAIGDLNGDGKPDLAVTNLFAATVSVLLGNGDGSFGAKTDFGTGSQPWSLAIGDLNGDGKPDLAVANYTSNTVSVLLGNGGGTFGASSNHATGLNPLVVAIGNLNADGIPDLAVANSSSNTVSVLPGSGAGTFGAKTDFGTGIGAFSVVIADLNGDGRADLAAANYGAKTVSVLLWQLVATFTSLGSIPNPSFIGGTVTLTAFVTPAGVTGSVTFHDGAAPLGTATLSAGVATMTTAALGLGNHSLTAAYGGNGVFAASVSAISVHSVIPVDPTTLALTSSPRPSVVGQAVLLTATVSPAAATGSVEFRNGGTAIGTAALASGQATLTVPGFTVGSHSLSAAYAGDPGHSASTSPVLVHVVNPAPTVVTLLSSVNPSRLTQAVNFTASVRDSAGGSSVITGTVEFVIDSVVFGPPVVLSGGSVTVSGITSLTVGAHAVHAIYVGDASFLGSTSPTITQVVESPKPVLVAVRDVVNDQGGHVGVIWNASDLDLAPYNAIESYWILRSAPATAVARASQAGARVSPAAPGSIDASVGAFLSVQAQGTTYYWEYIASLPASQSPQYTFVAATTCDSMAGSNPLTAFMIMARTPGGAQWWFSDPDSGYSVDNLAPLAPVAFTGAYGAGTATLHWGSSPEADLGQYRLHRGATVDFVPGPGNLVMAGADTVYVDAAAALYYYKLCAVDVHGNASGFTLLLPSGTTGVAGGASPAFALEGVRPNPSRGEPLSVAFTLPTAASARFELVDISGRRVVEREVGALGAGRHSVAIAPDRRLAPGLYLLRLTQGRNVSVTRVAVLK